jgi:hypothetical protein
MDIVIVRHAPHMVARFFLMQNTKAGKIYQMAIKYAKMDTKIPR